MTTVADTKVRPHGTRAKYVGERCRCTECRAANAAYQNSRQRRNAHRKFGIADAMTDAEPARQHVHDLMDQGLGWRRIARLANVSNGAMSKLLYGDTRRGSAPSKWVRPSTANRLLAVTADQAADGARVNSIGTHRRLQALLAIGWTYAELGRQLDKDTSAVWAILERDHVEAGTAKAVREVYEQLWNKQPPQDTPHLKRAVTVIRKLAAARGWLPPMAWDDDTIDSVDAAEAVSVLGDDIDPVAVERCLGGDRPDRMTRDERVLVAREVLARGGDVGQLSELLRCSGTAAVQLLEAAS